MFLIKKFVLALTTLLHLTRFQSSCWFLTQSAEHNLTPHVSSTVFVMMLVNFPCNQFYYCALGNKLGLFILIKFTTIDIAMYHINIRFINHSRHFADYLPCASGFVCKGIMSMAWCWGERSSCYSRMIDLMGKEGWLRRVFCISTARKSSTFGLFPNQFYWGG